MDQYPSFLAPVDPAQDELDTGESDGDRPVDKAVEPVVYANLFSANPAGGRDVVGRG